MVRLPSGHGNPVLRPASRYRTACPRPCGLWAPRKPQHQLLRTDTANSDPEPSEWPRDQIALRPDDLPTRSPRLSTKRPPQAHPTASRQPGPPASRTMRPRDRTALRRRRRALRPGDLRTDRADSCESSRSGGQHALALRPDRTPEIRHPVLQPAGVSGEPAKSRDLEGPGPVLPRSVTLRRCGRTPKSTPKIRESPEPLKPFGSKDDNRLATLPSGLELGRN
jgi:hypothetical protein